jgi:hypothetical protein
VDGGGGWKSITDRKASYVSEDDHDSYSSDNELIDPLLIHPIEEAQINDHTIAHLYPTNDCHDVIKYHIMMRTNQNFQGTCNL